MHSLVEGGWSRQRLEARRVAAASSLAARLSSRARNDSRHGRIVGAHRRAADLVAQLLALRFGQAARVVLARLLCAAALGFHGLPQIAAAIDLGAWRRADGSRVVGGARCQLSPALRTGELRQHARAQYRGSK